MELPQDPSPNKKKLSQYNSYLKYSGLGFQLLVTLGVAGWLGYKLDQYLSLTFPAFMLLFGLLALTGSIYLLYRAVNK